MIFAPSSPIAFKEWAAVCEALAAGRQTIILRKGGIREGRAGFRIEHREFWLYPTNFHQADVALTSDASEFVARAMARPRTPGVVPVQHYAVVHEVRELATEEAAWQLAGLHIWSEATVRQRFNYKQPGLFLLLVRMFVAPQPTEVTESAEMAGCKSWVTLPGPLTTAGLEAVLSDREFADAAAAVWTALGESS